MPGGWVDRTRAQPRRSGINLQLRSLTEVKHKPAINQKLSRGRGHFGWAALLLAATALLSWGAPDDFTVESALGSGKFRLAEARGRYVALHFLLKTECPVCLRHTRSYLEQSASIPAAVQVFLKPDSPEEIRAWAEKLDLAELNRIPLYRDPEATLAKAYRIPFGYQFHGETVHYPAFLLLDPQGREVFRYVGESNRDRFSFDDFAAKLAELKGQRQPRP